MPYIKKERRALFDEAIETLAKHADKPGEWNYCVTRFVHRVIENHSLSTGPAYALLNATMGAMLCAMLELYRMVAAPCENRKHAENGSVSSLDA